MDRIPGVALDTVLKNLSLDDRQRITNQLRRHMEELRSIPRPARENPSMIASVGGGPIYCIRLHGDQDLSGPFRDEQHMNRQLRNDRPLEDFADPVVVLHSTSHRIVLTHNDFAPRNVMVLQNESGQWDVSVIIDWDAAAWLPEYWEYTKTVNVSAWEPDPATRIWHEMIPHIIDVYAVEAEADRILDNAIPNRPYKHIP